MVAALLVDMQADFNLGGLETDFANPAAWSQQAYIKFLANGRIKNGPFVVEYHEKSSAPGTLLPGHWLGIHVEYMGQTVGAPAVFLGLGDINRTNQQLIFQRHEEALRAFFFHLVKTREPQYAPAAAMKVARLAKLPWGESSAAVHLRAPPV